MNPAPLPAPSPLASFFFLSQFFHGVVFVPVVLSLLPDRLVSHRAGTAAVTHGDSSSRVSV